MSRILIIGGGAAGLSAAVTAAMLGDRVVVAERMEKVGKKLLATGNGRCNLMNTGKLRYPRGASFARKVLTRCGAEQQKLFWQDLGLRLRQEDEGRVYPVSGQASTVLETLQAALRRWRVDVRTGVAVSSISASGGHWMAEGLGSFDRVIVAGGGMAQSKLGSDGSAYALLTSRGHSLAAPQPALVPLETDTRGMAGLSGIRVRGRVSVLVHDAATHVENGEILFTDYGLSGVCVMQCASYAREPEAELSLNLACGMGFEDQSLLVAELQRRAQCWRQDAAAELLTGLCVRKLGHLLLRRAGISPEAPMESLNHQAIRRLGKTLCDLRIHIKRVRGFEYAQVTAGGILTEDFSPDTLMSRRCPGLHAAGEVLNVDGDCGGFNLMFAFGSGIMAGANGRTCAYIKGVSP